MEKYFRADGLMLDGMPIILLKRTNLHFVGASWNYFDGLVWHLSEEAMDLRIQRRLFGSRVFKLKFAQIKFEDFYEVRKKYCGSSKEIVERYKKLEKNKFSPSLAFDGQILENVCHELEQFF